MDLPANMQLLVEDDLKQADAEFLADGLEEFNDKHWPGHQPWLPLGVYVREQGVMVAGLAGQTYGGALFVKFLWVREDLRGQGLGRTLLLQAEQRAIERGCRLAWLDTFSFQAPDFYRRLGYEVFGEISVSPEHRRIFLRKRL